MKPSHVHFTCVWKQKATVEIVVQSYVLLPRVRVVRVVRKVVSFLCLLEKIFIYLRIYCCCASMQRLSSIPSILPAMFVLEKVTLLSISQSNLPASFGFQLLGAWLRAVPSGAVVALGAQEVSGSAHMCRLASMIWGALLYGNCPVPCIFWGSIFLDK